MRNNIKICVKKNSLKIQLFILLFSVVLIFRIAGVTYSSFYRMGVFIFEFFISCIGIWKYLINRYNDYYTNNVHIVIAKKICFLFLTMQIVMQIYGYLLAFFGYTSFDLLSTNIQSFIAPLFVFATVNLFKEKAIDIITESLIVNFCITFIVNIIYFGPSSIFQVFESIFTGQRTIVANSFEVHSNSFAVGVLFLYYLINSNVDNRKRYLPFLLLASIFGQKRIQFAAMAVCVILYILKNQWSKNKIEQKNILRFYKLITILVFVLSIIYVVISLDGTLANLYMIYNINDSYRSSMYQIISSYSHFGIDYLGIGRNAAGKIIGRYYNNHYNSSINNLHNDILKMYVENGFVLYILWLLIYLVYIPRLSKRLSNKSASYEAPTNNIIIIVYMFVLYLTDNVEAYVIVQNAMLLSLIFTISSSYIKAAT